MSGAGEIEEAFAPPRDLGVEPEPPREVSHYRRAAQLHLLVLALAVAVHAFATGSIQLELWAPEASMDPELFVVLLGLHGASRITLVMPATLGLLVMLARPLSLRIYEPWLAYASAVLWGGGLLALLAVHAGVPSFSMWGAVALLLGSAVPALALLAVWLVRRRAPAEASSLLAVGGMATVLTLVVFAVELVGLSVGWAVDPGALTRVLDVAVFPLVLGIGVERLRGTRTHPMLLGFIALSVLGQDLLLPLSRSLFGLSVLGALAMLYLAVRVTVAWGRHESRLHPVPLAHWLSVVSLTLAVVVEVFVGTLSVDVHLHDTYFVLAPGHLVAGALVLSLVALLVEHAPLLFGREPRRLPCTLGVLGVGLGLLGSAFVMMVVGQQGMPLHYQSYIPPFESLHRMIGWGGLAAAIGGGLTVASIATGARAPATAAPGSDGQPQGTTTDP